MKHSPTPWEKGSGEAEILCRDDGNVVALCTTDQADRGFIINAVNSYEPMFMALRNLKRRAEELADWTRRLDARLIEKDGRDPAKEPELGELWRIREAIEQAINVLTDAMKGETV